jgi:hypothetical protein
MRAVLASIFVVLLFMVEALSLIALVFVFTEALMPVTAAVFAEIAALFVLIEEALSDIAMTFAVTEVLLSDIAVTFEETAASLVLILLWLSSTAVLISEKFRLTSSALAGVPDVKVCDKETPEAIVAEGLSAINVTRSGLSSIFFILYSLFLLLPGAIPLAGHYCH